MKNILLYLVLSVCVLSSSSVFGQTKNIVFEKTFIVRDSKENPTVDKSKIDNHIAYMPPSTIGPFPIDFSALRVGDRIAMPNVPGGRITNSVLTMPNLTYYTPPGWSDAIVITNVSTSNGVSLIEPVTLYNNEQLYIKGLLPTEWVNFRTKAY